jgi:DNA polymerase-1
MSGTVYFDLESASAKQLYRTPPGSGYVRLCGAAADDRPGTGVTADPAKLLRVLEGADRIVAYNGLGFDLPALARHAGADYDALARKTWDPYVAAKTQDPPGSQGQAPWGVKGYYGLDALAQRLGVAGKVTGENGLRALALRHGPREGTEAERVAAGYGMIPVDDPDYTAYLRQDVQALRDVVRTQGAPTPYLSREMGVAHLQNRPTVSGWRIDVPLLEQKVAQENERTAASLRWLADNCGIPLTKTVGSGRGAARVTWQEEHLSPLSTTVGREALEKALIGAGAEYLPRTASGKLALSSDALGEESYMVGKGGGGRRVVAMLNPAAYGHLPRVREICQHVVRVTGATAKYAEIQKHLVGDRVHPEVGGDQAAGRWAYARPSTTNLGKHGAKVLQRAPFLADAPDAASPGGYVLLSCDMDQLDMRVIAARCQDPAYMEMFGPGMDAHAMIADQVFGRHDGEWRERAKRTGHGWNYGLGLRGMVNGGIPEDIARKFIAGMEQAFPVLIAKRLEWIEQGEAGELLDNGFGRLMRCDPRRAYTQAPALIGQGGARDVMAQMLLNLPDYFAPWLRGVVHDEVIVSVPREYVREATKILRDAGTFEWKGVRFTCGVSRPGDNWAACYAKAA